MFYSGFMEEHLIPGHNMVVEKLLERQKRKKELADKVKGLRQSEYAHF